MGDSIPRQFAGTSRMIAEFERAYTGWSEQRYRELAEAIEDSQTGATRNSSLAALVSLHTGLQPSEFDAMPLCDRLPFVEKTAAAVGVASAEPDGPAGNCQWRHNGELIAEQMRVGAWRLANYLFPSGSIQFDDIPAVAFDDHGRICDGSSAGSLRRDANAYWDKHGIPLQFSVKKGTITLSAK